jgi:hypothetical protein
VGQELLSSSLLPCIPTVLHKMAMEIKHAGGWKKIAPHTLLRNYPGTSVLSLFSNISSMTLTHPILFFIFWTIQIIFYNDV